MKSCIVLTNMPNTKGMSNLMRVLKFVVTGQSITVDPTCDTSGLVAGSVGYLHAEFNVDAVWNGCKIAASFWNGVGESAAPVQNRMCVIPAKALTEHSFSVSLTGVKPGYRIQTNKVKLFQEVL